MLRLHLIWIAQSERVREWYDTCASLDEFLVDKLHGYRHGRRDANVAAFDCLNLHLRNFVKRNVPMRITQLHIMHDRVGMCEIKLEVCQNEVVDTQVYVVLLDATHMRDQLLRHTALILRQL